ncbi:MAG TPA: hypothetical protein PLE52_07470 [Paludibacteraceae bacterium]|nr:hypothetical protein [Paludibacteraceae bacterium]
MVIIVDDTFINRHDIGYLEEEQYQKICKVFSIIKTTEISQIIKLLQGCSVFCNHKTLQLYNNAERPLNIEDNTKYCESLWNEVKKASIQRIEFSRGLETNYETNKINKDLFYNNLKSFLDFKIERNIYEVKILYWGNNFKEKERLTIIQNMLMQIRMVNISEFENNSAIKNGLSVLYPNQDIKKIIKRWIDSQFSNNDIIKEINNSI